MGEIAYKVRDEYASAGFQGGDMAVGDATYHLGDALERGHGYVVVDESENMILTIRLSEQPALEPCPVDEARRVQARKSPTKKADD